MGFEACGVLKLNNISCIRFLNHAKKQDLATHYLITKLNNIGRKVKVGLGARENFIRQARQLQKIIENAI